MSWESWLKDKMDKRKYRHRSAAINDIVVGLRPFPDLKPEVDKFAISQQRAEDYICCKGTIPVRYKGSVYNIPIKVWILDNHPFVPPLVFVTPTSAMVIKPGRHVDTTGRVYLPYLSDWKNPTSDLHGLIQVLCMVFGDDPPVFSRGSQPPGRPPPPNLGSQPNYPGAQHQYTPYPTSQPSGMPMPNPQPGGYPSNQAPYPSGGGRMPYPTSTSGVAPYPTSTSLPTSSYQSHSSQPPPAHQPPAHQPPYPAMSSGYNPSSGYAPYPVSTAAPVSRAPETQTFQERNAPTRQGSVIDPKVLKMSMVSSVEEKLRKRVNEVFEQAKRELDDLGNTNNELKERSQQLGKIMDRLQQEENMATSNVEILEKKNKELAVLMDKLENDTANMNIDEAVVTTAPLYNQILNTFAEENAVEDAIYYLGEALRREVIDLEVFLKNVRSLSRKQFFLRAQLKKARKTAGLKELTVH
eukprot:Seg6229.1 transcript_id=Seg6229.1/GoldUCD/mRNA.D3Y31 product="Tumor susceptibility gene 101 protein" protein_id=Seg6229.1/GoldUCD/D3Y31